ncbi:MAG: hypothetical protein ACREGR_02320 [Minisyncoccia bacterium]
MHPDFTNLLPEDRAHSMTRDYWLRLAALAIFLLTALIVLNALLLAPSYAIVEKQIASKQSELAALETANASSGASSYAALLADFNKRAAALASLPAESLDIPLLIEVLGVPHPGVALTSFTFAPQTKGAAPQLSLNGTAATRDALRSYDLALSQAPFAANANLPVSAYAAESDLPFTLTLTFVSP